MQDVEQVSFFLLSFPFPFPGPSFPPQTCSVCLSALVCRLQVGKSQLLSTTAAAGCVHGMGRRLWLLCLRKLVRVALVMLTFTSWWFPHSAQAMPTATCAIKTMIGLQKSTVNLAALSTALATPMLTVRKFLFFGFFYYGGWGRKPFFYSRDLFSGSAILSRLLSSCFV